MLNSMENLDFEPLLCKLSENNVKFIIIGGVACALNGFVRATEDIDILIDTSDNNVEKLLSILSNWGQGHAKELKINDFTLEPGSIRINEDFPLDIFTLIVGKSYSDLIDKCKQTKQGINYLNPNDLIETKQNTGREKDQIDIQALKKLDKLPHIML